MYKPSYINITIEFIKEVKKAPLHKQLHFLQKLKYETFTDPFYVDKIILPVISVDTLPLMLEYMKDKDEFYI